MFLFGGRIFATGIFQIVYVYTPEVYPTKVRGIGTGIMTSAGRLGALVTPLIAQVRYRIKVLSLNYIVQALFPVNSYVALSLYILTSLILAVFSILLPIETKGRSLRVREFRRNNDGFKHFTGLERITIFILSHSQS